MSDIDTNITVQFNSKPVEQNYVPCKTDADTEDPEWAPGKAAKRVRHTYSTRGIPGRQRGRQTRTVARDGSEITRPPVITTTPRISVPKALAALEASPRHDWRTSEQQASPLFARTTGRRRIHTSTHAQILWGSEHIWDGLQNSLRTLLTATRAISEESRKDRKGTRSLFASCLSQVPRYIIETEALNRYATSDETEDVSLGIYAELEGLSQNPKAGWRPLREIVRAHGIAILVDAVQELFIPLRTAWVWALICADKGCLEEGDRIIEAIIKVRIEHGRDLNPTENMTFDELTRYLIRYGSQYNRNQLLWHFLVGTLSSGQQGISWFMDSNRQDLWGCMIGQILHRGQLENRQGVDALLALLFEKAIYPSSITSDTLVHRLRVKSHQIRCSRLVKPLKLDASCLTGEDPSLSRMPWMYLSIMEVFASMTIVRPLRDNPALAALQSVIKHIQIVRDTIFHPTMTEFQNCISALLFVTVTLIDAFEVLDCECLPDTRAWQDALDRLDLRQQTFDVLGRLVCSIAESCGGVSMTEPRICLEKMARHLLEISRCSGPQATTRIAVNAAFDFSERHRSRDNMDLALELEEEAESMAVSAEGLRPQSTPARNHTYPAFRWEESISEWVSKTPVAAARRSKASEHNINVLVPSRPAMQQTRQGRFAPVELKMRSGKAINTSTRQGSRRNSRFDERSSHVDDSEEEDDDQAYDTEGIESDAESYNGSGWSAASAEDRHHSPASTPGSSMGNARVVLQKSPPTRSLRSNQDRPKFRQPWVVIPPVSHALKRCFSEANVELGRSKISAKRARCSDGIDSTFLARDGKTIVSQQMPGRLQHKATSVYTDDYSEDELGM